jgi:hypothetical protein
MPTDSASVGVNSQQIKYSFLDIFFGESMRQEERIGTAASVLLRSSFAQELILVTYRAEGVFPENPQLLCSKADVQRSAGVKKEGAALI